MPAPDRTTEGCRQTRPASHVARMEGRSRMLVFAESHAGAGGGKWWQVDGRQGGRRCRKARRQAPQPHLRRWRKGAISRESAFAWQEQAGALAGDWQDVRLNGRRARRRQGVADGLRSDGVGRNMLHCVAGPTATWRNGRAWMAQATWQRLVCLSETTGS